MSGKFNPLGAEDIEVRVAQATQKGVSLLLYKTARTDANMLDEVYGVENWQNDFKLIDGVLFCGIGIKAESGEWIWKWDCGTESNTEKEKGEASDAFKRAGFRIGCGRELYTAPFVWVGSDKCKMQQNERTQKWETKDRFRVSKIAYDGGKIASLTIENSTKGCDVFWYERPGSKIKHDNPDDEPWTPPVAPKVAPATPARQAKQGEPTLTDTDCKRIADIMQSVFAGHPKQYEAFERLTGYKASKAAMKKIPRSDFMRVIQAISLNEDDAVALIFELEHENESETA